MPLVANAADGPESEQNDVIRSEDWPEDVNTAYSYESDRMQFTGDGLNTGVRVLGLWTTTKFVMLYAN